MDRAQLEGQRNSARVESISDMCSVLGTTQSNQTTTPKEAHMPGKKTIECTIALPALLGGAQEAPVLCAGSFLLLLLSW